MSASACASVSFPCFLVLLSVSLALPLSHPPALPLSPSLVNSLNPHPNPHQECAATVARQIQPLNARIQYYIGATGPGSQAHSDTILSPSAASTRTRSRAATDGETWDERLVGMLSPGSAGAGGQGGDGDDDQGAAPGFRRGRGKSPRARRVVSMSNMVEAATKGAISAADDGAGEVEEKERRGGASTS